MTEFKIRNDLRPLTAFRFLAAFYVFLFHIQITVPVFGDGPLGAFIAEGAVGMTMFFTLSGVILTHAYLNAKIDLREFFWNRFARIYPIYALAAFLALTWLLRDVATEAQATSYFYALIAALILLVTRFLLLQAWLPQTFAFWKNSASWSISNEAFFYALFPFARDIFARLSVYFCIVLLIGFSILSSLVSLSSIVFSNSTNDFALFYALPIFRLPEFLSGMIAYLLVTRVRQGPKLKLILWCFAFLGVLHVAFLGKILPGYTLHNWIVVPAVCAALALLFSASSDPQSMLGHRVLVWLGKISYCLYSFQFHVLEGLRAIVPTEMWGGWIYAVAATVLLLLVSAAAHYFLEEPARIWIRSRSRQRLATSAVSG